MAHVLHNDGHDHDDTGCRDCTGTGGHMGDDCTGDRDETSRKRRRRRRRHRRDCDCLIPVGTINIDCSPATFRTPGQARSVVSCAVSQTFNVPVTRTVLVQEPTDFGCFICRPVTETVEVPVTATVNVPPVLVPVPRVVCPPTATAGLPCPCPTAPAMAKSHGCGCGK